MRAFPTWEVVEVEEGSDEESENSLDEVISQPPKHTRSGRQVKRPRRYNISWLSRHSHFYTILNLFGRVALQFILVMTAFFGWPKGWGIVHVPILPNQSRG